MDAALPLERAGPVLSVILPARLGFSTILPALAAWDAQTAAAETEVVILCPDGRGPTAAEAAGLSDRHVVVMTGDRDLHGMRALGVARARGEFVVLAEDHCIPDPEFAAAVRARLREGWDGVGPALRPGERSTAWALGSFLIGYGEWLEPVASGPTSILCGWNGTIRRSLLLGLGDELADLMRLGCFLVRRLRERGARFFIDSAARMRHFDPVGGRRQVLIHWVIGQGFGGMRTRGWSVPTRWLFVLAAPACAAAHWKRALVHYRRAGRAAGIAPAAVGAAAVLAAAWGAAEAVGSLCGIDRVAPALWIAEAKPVSAEAIARSDALERARESPAPQIARSDQSSRSSGRQSGRIVRS